MNSDFSFLATYARLTFDFNFLSKKSIGLFESRRSEIRHQRSVQKRCSDFFVAEPPGEGHLALSALRRTKSEAIMAVSPAPGEGWQSANGAPFYCIFFLSRP